MENLALQRCINHHEREAVACCPECKHCFCRECVTEHDERVLCAACLRKLAPRKNAARQHFRAIVRTLQCLAAIILIWLAFFTLGRALLALPTSFHDGTLWQEQWWQE